MHASLTLHFAFFTIFAFFAFYAKVPFFLQFHFLASTSIDLSTSRVADGLPFDTETPKKRIVEIKEGEREEIYVYEHIVADPEMLQLSRLQLCEEAIYKRQLCVSSMEQMCLCIDDYQKAEAGAVGAPGERFSMAY